MLLNLYGFWHKKVNAYVEFSKPTTETQEEVSVKTFRSLKAQTREQRSQQKDWQIHLLGQICDEDTTDKTEDGEEFTIKAGQMHECKVNIFDYEDAINAIDGEKSNEDKTPKSA